MDNAQWPQELVMRPMEEIVPIIGNTSNTRAERKAIRFQKDQVLNCPRCNSANTKFCYYNNYSLSQPRYFCKTCRRYWTAGGSLRNIPVGGGSRKNKKPSSSSSLKKVADLVPPVPISADQSSSKIHGGDNNGHQDLNLGGQLSAMELLTGFTSIVPISDPNLLYSPGISLPEPKQCLKICLDGTGNYQHHHHHHLQAMQDSTNNNRRFLLSSVDLKGTASDDGADQDRDWNNNGVLMRGGGGGESW